MGHRREKERNFVILKFQVSVHLLFSWGFSFLEVLTSRQMTDISHNLTLGEFWFPLTTEMLSQSLYNQPRVSKGLKYTSFEARTFTIEKSITSSEIDDALSHFDNSKRKMRNGSCMTIRRYEFDKLLLLFIEVYMMTRPDTSFHK